MYALILWIIGLPIAPQPTVAVFDTEQQCEKVLDFTRKSVQVKESARVHIMLGCYEVDDARGAQITTFGNIIRPQ